MSVVIIFIAGLFFGFMSCALLASAKKADKIIENKNEEWESDD